MTGLAVAGLGVWLGRDTRPAFERGLVGALGGETTGVSGCGRASPGVLYCSVQEDNLTPGDRLRVVCQGARCQADCPLRGADGTSDPAPVSFVCDAGCRQDVAHGYVYQPVYGDPTRGDMTVEGEDYFPAFEGLDLGRIETDVDIDAFAGTGEDSESYAYDVITPSGRRATVEAARVSKDPKVHRVLVVTFPDPLSPRWKPVSRPQPS